MSPLVVASPVGSTPKGTAVRELPWHRPAGNGRPIGEVSATHWTLEGFPGPPVLRWIRLNREINSNGELPGTPGHADPQAAADTRNDASHPLAVSSIIYLRL